MSNDADDLPFLVLIAPNVSEQMGGEAIKALQIVEELKATGVAFHQITHSRVREEMKRRFPDVAFSYVEEDWITTLIWKSVVFRYMLVPYFMYRASKLAAKIVKDHPGAVVHYTSPVSPVVPRFSVPGAPVVIGPINGNVHYPPAFYDREPFPYRIRRLFLKPSQIVHKMLFSGVQRAEALIVSGGQRTVESLKMAGCRDEQICLSLDSGIPNRLGDQPLVVHEGTNLRFVHNGRLVVHKGTDFVIKSLPRTKNRIELDVIGRGPMKPKLVKLVEELGLQDRVHFIEWFQDHRDLVKALRSSRAFVFPSIAEANGIVVQEAMMMGLPTICANWGGPALLINPECGILVDPSSEEAMLNGLAEAMDRLAENPDLANEMAAAGRATAMEQGFLWKDLIRRWFVIYRNVARPAPTEIPQALAASDAK